ncbi:MAG: PAS domain S-box protein [Bacillota bacterium]|nr:PAS domain S-box protein [Bacillota bacterium]
MDFEYLDNFIVNAAVTLSASVFCGLFYHKISKTPLFLKIIYGFCVALIGILLLVMGGRFDRLYLLDSKTVLVCITGMFYGPIPACVSVAILSIARILIGGPGVLAYIFIMVIASAFGLMWNYFNLNRLIEEKKYNYLDFYLLGIVIHVIMLVCIYMLPDKIAKVMFAKFSLPVILIYPLTMFMACIIITVFIRKLHTDVEIQESEMRFKTLCDQAPIGAALKNNNQILYCNAMFEKILGRSKEEINEKGLESFVHPDDFQDDLDRLNLFKEGKISEYSIDKSFIKPDGSIIWVNLILASCDEKNGAESKYICLLHDITEKIEIREQLKEGIVEYKRLYQEHKNRQILLQSLFDSSSDWIFYRDIAGAYLGCNKAFEKYTGMSEEKLKGLNYKDVLPKELADFAKATDAKLIDTKKPVKFEQTLTYPNGDNVIVEILKSPYIDECGNIQGVFCIARDITERKAREEKILYLSNHDPLTGLYNRTYYNDQIKHLKAENIIPVSLIMGDVNGLKLINDAFGHGEGDVLLIQISEILKSCVQGRGIISRIGGDEFCILLPHVEGEETIQIFNDIINKYKEISEKSENKLHYTGISLGYASRINENVSLDDTIKEAEEYMYRRELLAHKGMHSTILTSIMTALHEKSHETQQHAKRIAYFAKKLGEALGLSHKDLDNIELASALHDIGKISVDLSILQKPGKLNEEEWKIIKKHPEVGYRIAQAIPELVTVSEIIFCHHERWDGTGYPRQIAGDEIPLLARIISLADSYDAMTSDREYHKGISKEEAMVEILRCAGTQFDPYLAEVFVKLVLVNEPEK